MAAAVLWDPEQVQDDIFFALYSSHAELVSAPTCKVHTMAATVLWDPETSS
jgi:hypothetical protein